MSQGGDNLLCCGRFIATTAMATLSQACLCTGRCNGGVCHHVMSQGGDNLLCCGRLIATTAMASFGQASFHAGRCDSGICHHVMSQGRDNLLCCGRFIATSAVASFGQARLCAGRCDSGVCHHVMSQGIYIILLDHAPAGATPQCVALLGTSRRHDCVLILVTHVGHHNAVDGEAVSAVALVRHQTDRQSISADSNRLACQLRPGVLRPVHIEVVDICLHLGLRRECHIQRKSTLRLISIGLIQIILVIVTGLRISCLVQGFGLLLVDIDGQLSLCAPPGHRYRLCPRRGQIVFSQRQKARSIGDRFHAAILVRHRHYKVRHIQRFPYEIDGFVCLAGNRCGRRIAVSRPNQFASVAVAGAGCPLTVPVRIECIYA